MIKEMPLTRLVGLAERDVMATLEETRGATLRQLTGDLQWPVHLLMMSIGSLLRGGVVTVIRSGPDICVMPSLDEEIEALEFDSSEQEIANSICAELNGLKEFYKKEDLGAVD
jgi:hypothetical protein